MTTHTTGITAGTCDCKVVTIQKTYGRGIRIESATWEPCTLHKAAPALLEAARAMVAWHTDPSTGEIARQCSECHSLVEHDPECPLPRLITAIEAVGGRTE